MLKLKLWGVEASLVYVIMDDPAGVVQGVFKIQITGEVGIANICDYGCGGL